MYRVQRFLRDIPSTPGHRTTANVARESIAAKLASIDLVLAEADAAENKK
jgi:hypothetical protein